MTAIRRLAFASALVCGLASCDPGPSWYFNRDGVCDNGTEPDLMRDVENCGACEHACDLVGAAEHACVAGVCAAAACEAGYFDRDGDPDNGCECQGEAPDTCTTCRAYETTADGLDDDCDGETDEGDGMPLSRAHCGAFGASCLLPPGAKDVRCELLLCPAGDTEGCGTCEAKGEAGHVRCGLCVPVEPDTVRVEQPDECFDAIDNDGDGVVDNGPHCEVLLANAARPECNWSAPSAACPPHPVFIKRARGPLDVLRVDLTTDVLMDRYEVTRAQFAAFARERGDCDPSGAEGGMMASHGGCAVEPWEAKLPVTGVTWCEAYEYCQWAGKRLPTLAEWHRAAAADYAGPTDPRDAQAMAEAGEDPCYAEHRPALGRCNASGPQPVDSLGGAGYVGAPGSTEAVLRVMGFFNLTGNVTEWLFDEQVDACARRPDGRMAIAGLSCPEPGVAVQQTALLDWSYSTLEAESAPRMLCGGGWTGAEDAFRRGEHQFADPGIRAAHYGFRCGRSQLPEPAYAATWPYDATLEPEEYARCEAPPVGPVIARSGRLRTAIAVEACVADGQPTARAQPLDVAFKYIVARDSIRWLLTHDQGANEVTLGSVFDAGDEQFRLVGEARRTTKAQVGDGCLLGDCPSAVLGEQTEISIGDWDRRTLRMVAGEVVALDLSDHRPECPLYVDAPIIARVEVLVDADGLVSLLGSASSSPGRLDGLLPCVERDAAGRCLRRRVRLEVAFSPL